MEVVHCHVQIHDVLLDTRVQMQAFAGVQIAYRAAFGHVIHAVAVVEIGDRGEDEPLLAVERLLVVSRKIRSPVSVYIARREGAYARGGIVIHGMGNGVVRHVPPSG